jgi:hypothetical protein
MHPVTNAFRCQGRRVDASQLEWLQHWIGEHPDWSRKRLARELCGCWQWQDPGGRLQDFAARSFLLKLEARGLIGLPVLQRSRRRPVRKADALVGWEEPAVIETSLSDLQPVHLESVMPSSAAARRWAFFLDRYHYLGWRLVGKNVGYLASDRQGRELACLLFGAPAWRSEARDQHLRWNSAQRAAQLYRVANNTRLLILPWVRVAHLASQVLGQAVRRIDSDWQAKYGHGLDWLETFVDTRRYGGTCYRAANWTWVGQTTGRSRQDRHHTVRVSPKAVYLYCLKR